MKFISIPNKIENIFKEHLSEIKSIKFTFREIDILVCILHNRGEKKIASMLSISPRTVSAHVYNILGKLGYNSKDQIIDFIEKSDKLPIFKEYYLHLLVKSNFEKQLAYIGSRINRNGFRVYCYRDDINGLAGGLYKKISEHLKLANINLIEVSDENNCKEGDLIFELNKIREDNYHQDLFYKIVQLINPDQKEELIKEFEENCKVVQNIYDSATYIGNNLQAKDNNKFVLTRKLSLVVFSALVGMILVFLLIKLTVKDSVGSLEQSANQKNKQTSLSSTTEPEIIKELEELLKITNDKTFSADNTNVDQIQKNHSLVKKIEKILNQSNIEEMQEYLKNSEMPSQVLTSYLYNIQALASYYMYNMHDGEMSKKLLLYGKGLAEHYVNIRGNVENNFDQLSNEEILSELGIIKDLAQIYIRIIYSLGRTFIYTNNAIDGKKYFELAKYLGNKLNLFEGYLSDISGLLIIESDMADDQIKEQKYNLAKENLQNIIDVYARMLEYEKEYTINYKPTSPEQQTIVPNKNFYNLFECGTRIITAYIKLIKISKDKQEIQNYVNEISKYFIGNAYNITNSKTDNNTKKNQAKSFVGLIKLLEKIPDKKQTNLYNKLGDFILTVWEVQVLNKFEIDYKALEQAINQELLENINNPTKGTEATRERASITQGLLLAEKLYSKARNKSRSSDYTKLDAYNGLVKTYKLILSHNVALSENQKKDIQNQINIITNKIGSTKRGT